MLISVIIPTLQLNPKFKILLAILNADPCVGEIIVIDNACKGLDCDFSKLRVIIPKQNLFVNPSWNLGVEQAKYDYFALFNDDLLVAKNFCSQVLTLLSPNMGIVGMCADYVNNTELKNFKKLPKTEKIWLKKVKTRHFCFGVILFGHKSAYHKISEDLKINFGDDFLLYINRVHKRQNFVLCGANIYHLQSLSSSKKEFNNFLETEHPIYRSLAPKNALPYRTKVQNLLIKAICALIPNNKYRKKLRAYLNY